tara:strand:- start:816 stop:992 length:177 start_codon:yes stop_codon:yes gene_type:complete
MPETESKMKVEEALNLVVGITRQVKVTYDEHKMIEEAISVIVESVNKNTSKTRTKSTD